MVNITTILFYVKIVMAINILNIIITNVTILSFYLL